MKEHLKYTHAWAPLQTSWIGVSGAGLDLGTGSFLDESNLQQGWGQAWDCHIRRKGCEEGLGLKNRDSWCNLFHFWPVIFGLEPKHIRVISPSGAFHVLQASFYGRLIWSGFKLRGVGGLESQTALWHKALGERSAPRWRSRKEDESKRRWTRRINGT